MEKYAPSKPGTKHFKAAFPDGANLAQPASGITLAVPKNRHWSGTQIRATSSDSRIIIESRRFLHAIQTCYLGPRRRLVIRSDRYRICANAAGTRRVER